MADKSARLGKQICGTVTGIFNCLSLIFKCSIPQKNNIRRFFQKIPFMRDNGFSAQFRLLEYQSALTLIFIQGVGRFVKQSGPAVSWPMIAARAQSFSRRPASGMAQAVFVTQPGNKIQAQRASFGFFRICAQVQRPEFKTSSTSGKKSWSFPSCSAKPTCGAVLRKPFSIYHGFTQKADCALEGFSRPVRQRKGLFLPAPLGPKGQL